MPLAVVNALKPGAQLAYNQGGGRDCSAKEIRAAARGAIEDLKVDSGPRRPGDPPALYAAEACNIQLEIGWRAQQTDIRWMIESAWRRSEKHPRGGTG